MLEKSLLNKNKIKNLMSDNYNIKIKYVNKINLGSANIFKLIDEKGIKYILKEYQSKYNEQSIDKEISICTFLLKNDVKVSSFIKTIDGKNFMLNDNHVITLQYFIEGYEMEKNKGNLEQTIESARYLGLIIEKLKDYQIENNFNYEDWYDIDVDNCIQKNKHLISLISEDDPYYFKIKESLENKIYILNELKKYDFSKFNDMTVALSHGDYSVMQFIYDDGKIKSVIDFASATFLPIGWEIIRSYSYIYEKNKNGNFDVDGFVIYIKEFLKYSHLNKSDIYNMALLYLVQLLKSSFGFKQYIENKNLDLLKFGLYRTKICNSLFKKIDVITNKLSEELDL